MFQKFFSLHLYKKSLCDTSLWRLRQFARRLSSPWWSRGTPVLSESKLIYSAGAFQGSEVNLGLEMERASLKHGGRCSPSRYFKLLDLLVPRGKPQSRHGQTGPGAIFAAC